MTVIGVLQADSVLPQFQPAHGNYPEMFEQLLTRPGVEVRHYNVVEGRYPDSLDDCDAYLITGSKMSVYDDDPWIRALEAFVVRCDEAKKKLIGICFGHQMVAQALGGKTEPAGAGWGVGVHHYARLPEAPDYIDDFSLVASHKDQVTEVPRDATVIASSEFCPVAGMILGDHILTFQGHPEFTRDYSRDLMNMRRDILGEDVFTSGIASLDDTPHGDTVSNWVVRFLEEGA